jgi:hypothetical protein
MVEIGDRIKVGTVAPNTGYYRHSLCSTTEAFVHGSILERCPNDDCLVLRHKNKLTYIAF